MREDGGLTFPSFFLHFPAVRQKAKDVVALLADDERLRDERKRAKKNQVLIFLFALKVFAACFSLVFDN